MGTKPPLTPLDTEPCRYNRSRGLFVPAAGGPDHIDPPWPASPGMCYITVKGVSEVSRKFSQYSEKAPHLRCRPAAPDL